MYRERAPLINLRMLPLGANIPPQAAPIPAANASGWRSIAPGDHWGGADENAWFHGEATIPESWSARAHEPRWDVALRLLLGTSPDFGWPEGLLYANGALMQGINQHHPDVLLPESALAQASIMFDVRAWSGMTSARHQLERAEVTLLNRDVEAFYHLLYSGVDLVDALTEGDPLVHPLFAALDSAYNAVDLRRPDDLALDASATKALGALRERLARLRASYDPARRPRITAIGHGHLDVAWLWQTHHTREKTARTFGVATALMDYYPEYHFLHTTPQVFDWLAQDYPELFARVRQRVMEGRFEAAGAMWLESDTNLVSGESLVRQILYGQRYLRETFGAEYDVLWLPDTFGYSTALPQIMVKSGLRAFMTTKMSWSDTNRLPHDTFRWRGIDGSETLAHFVTTPWLSYNPRDTYVSETDTYNGRLDVTATRKLWERYRDKSLNHDLLLIYGYGDGGAGPTRQLIESHRAMVELPGMPELTLGRADTYFRELRERVWSDPSLPVWDGELYLEYHRGVYTTQGWLKRLHRRNEERVLLAEALDAHRWALATASGAAASDERAALDECWRALLLHEFHDILPGSSIGPVYSDARRDLTALAQRLDTFIERTARDIWRLAASRDGVWIIHNPSPCLTPGLGALVTLPRGDAESAYLLSGERLTSQVIVTPSGQPALLVESPPIAGRGWQALSMARGEGAPATSTDALSATRTSAGGATLENAQLRVTLDNAGAVISLVDKRVPGSRELIPSGAKANKFIAFDDRPEKFDAWDIDAGYDRKAYSMGDGEITHVESGPLRASVSVTCAFLGSAIQQTISLDRGSPRLDFATRIDWHERHLLLKVAFPLDLRVTEARSEIQYGSIARPAHRNTSWDEARFETVAHRWVDLSEQGYGVALLNDGKYGHDIHDATIRLSLLRSPTYPDPEADQGAHDITYSLLPHLGEGARPEIITHAYALNRPPVVYAPETDGQATGEGQAQAPEPLFSSQRAGVVIEAVKRAADGDDLIVRVYEAIGARHASSVRCCLPVTVVVETDLLERPLHEGASPAYDLWRESRAASHDAPLLEPTDAHVWTFALRPYEVRTFRVTLTHP